MIVGDAKKTEMPAPKDADPFLIVKFFRIELNPSPVRKVTTVPTLPPSIKVTLGPPVLVNVIALPLKLMFSK